MPVVNVRITRDGVTAEQKPRSSPRSRRPSSGCSATPEHTHVIIEEVDPENWGFAGMLTTEYRQRAT